jgi:hypothetical protein
VIRGAGDFSVHEIRDEAIPLNPWHHNEAKPNHSSAIAMEHELLIGAEWPRERHPGQFDAAGRIGPQTKQAAFAKRDSEKSSDKSGV